MTVIVLMAAVLLTIALVGASVWMVRRHDSQRVASGTEVRSRTEQVIGQRGRVTEAIDPVGGTGRVVVGGEDWAASAEKPLALGAEVIIDGADGIVLHVSTWRPPV